MQCTTDMLQYSEMRDAAPSSKGTPQAVNLYCSVDRDYLSLASNASGEPLPEAEA
jgi:hypothetical protein